MEYFTEIMKIPRASGNEGAIAEYICDFAQKRGLFCVKDEYNNVFVRKSASEGFEDRKPVLFQAHTDMVCEKTADSPHDFSKDPITPVYKNGRVYADKTTLGADDGAGVAIMLRLMDECEPMGETEYLFTTCEETGMDGAKGFDYSLIHSEKVVNLDSEDELEACIGCAGNLTSEVRIPTKTTDSDGFLARLEVFGLFGGHSGIEIDKGRVSALKVLGTLLDAIYADMPFGIVELNGGGRDNVIPFRATATLCFYGKKEFTEAEKRVKEMKNELALGMVKEDKAHFGVSLKKLKESEKTYTHEKMLTFKSTSAVISMLLLSPQGVIDRYPDSGEVLASVNLGRAEITEDAAVFRHMMRSTRRARVDNILAQITRLSHVLGGDTRIVSDCVGWESARGSELQTAYSKACNEVFGKEPRLTVIHAGLECGIIADGLAKCGKTADIISIGPDVRDVHSPKESMDIASLDRLYRVVISLLS